MTIDSLGDNNTARSADVSVGVFHSAISVFSSVNFIRSFSPLAEHAIDACRARKTTGKNALQVNRSLALGDDMVDVYENLCA